MHPLALHYVGGIDEALTSFGMAKEALSPEEKAKMLEAYRARPKGVAAVTGAAGPTAPKPPAPGGIELDRTGYQGGYGTAGKMPGAVLQPGTGKVVGLPSKLAAFFL